MKRMILVMSLLMTLTACAALPPTGTMPTQEVPDTAPSDIPQPNMPNPASVYCTQQGNKLEIVTAADDSQSGVCIFPDGSSCDEWAYYQGECGSATQTSLTPAVTVDVPTKTSAGKEEQASGGYMPPGTTEEIVDWWGVIKGTEPGAQYDDYFERQDMGQIIYFGIDSMNPAVKSQIETLRDSDRIVHIFGTLISNVPDYNGSQILVERMEIEE